MKDDGQRFTLKNPKQFQDYFTNTEQSESKLSMQAQNNSTTTKLSLQQIQRPGAKPYTRNPLAFNSHNVQNQQERPPVEIREPLTAEAKQNLQEKASFMGKAYTSVVSFFGGAK